MSPAVSVQWKRPVRQGKWERLVFIAFGLALSLLCLLAAVKTGFWWWGAFCLAGLASAVWLALFEPQGPASPAMSFHAEQETGGLRLSEIGNWSHAESLCNYFRQQGIYPAIDLPADPADSRILLVGLTMERFATLLEGAKFDTIQPRQAA